MKSKLILAKRKTSSIGRTLAPIRMLLIVCLATMLAVGLFAPSPAAAQQQALNKAAASVIAYPALGGKVQSLDWSRLPRWMTLDLQLRGRLEDQTSDGYVSGNDAIYVLTRVWGGLEVRSTPWLLGYIQFMDDHALGLPLKYVASNMRDTFDDRQAFLEFHADNVKVIAGRQELSYGSERVVGISNWTNVSRTWDGFLGRIGDKNRLDVFSTSVVMIHPTSLDTHGAGLTFHGAVGTITSVPHTLLMPFVFIRTNPRVESQQARYGSETEVTPGGEATSTVAGVFYFDVLAVVQRGSYSNDSIRAGAGYVKTGFTSQHLPWKPRLLGEFDYASGNPHRDLQRIGTYDQQYPSDHNAFGLTDLFGFDNIKEERVNLNLTPAKHLSLLFQKEGLQASTRQDSLYNGAESVVVKPPAGGFLSDDIGREFDASGTYSLGEYIAMDVGVGHFSPGPLMRENAHGAPLTLAYFSLTYRFKVNQADGAP